MLRVIEREMVHLCSNTLGSGLPRNALIWERCATLTETALQLPAFPTLLEHFRYQVCQNNPHCLSIVLYTLGPTGCHILKWYWIDCKQVSIEIDPKVPEIYPSGVLLLNLKRNPFEPMNDVDIKHVTLKTAFQL